MSSQQLKNLKKPPPAPAARKHLARIAAAKKQTSISSLPAAAASSTKQTSCANLKEDNSISIKDEYKPPISNNDEPHDDSPVQAQYKTRHARKKLVNNVMDDDGKNFEIPEATNDSTSNQDHEE